MPVRFGMLRVPLSPRLLPQRLSDSRPLIELSHVGTPPVRPMSLPDSHSISRLRRPLRFGISPLSWLLWSSSFSSLRSPFRSAGMLPVSRFVWRFSSVSIGRPARSAGTVPFRSIRRRITRVTRAGVPPRYTPSQSVMVLLADQFRILSPFSSLSRLSLAASSASQSATKPDVRRIWLPPPGSRSRTSWAGA